MRIVKYLSIFLLALLVVASVSTVLASDDGSGSFISGDSDSEGAGTFESSDSDSEESDDEEVPLDDGYYDSDSGSASNDASSTVSLSKHATANPILILILSLMSAGGLLMRR